MRITTFLALGAGSCHAIRTRVKGAQQPKNGPGLLTTLATGIAVGAQQAFAGNAPHQPHLVGAEIGALSSLLSTKDESNGALQHKFLEFAAEHGRDYVTKHTLESVMPDGSAAKSEWVSCNEDQMDECMKRYEIFSQSVEQAHERNVESQKKHGSQVLHGITKFSDLTDDEFNKFYKGYKPATQQELDQVNAKVWKAEDHPADTISSSASSSGSSWLPKFMEQKKSPLVDHKDWREVGGIITPVKDQKHCGSCWAHSVVENVESLAIRDGLVDSSYRGSPQELVSCDTGIDNGCNGGSPMFGFYYLGKHPLETESEYPYTSGTGVRGKCKYNPDGPVETGEIWQFDGETDMKEFILKDDKTGGPISIAVYAVPWKTYKSGIFPASECEGQLDHAVQAVGLDLRGDTPYWIIRNSWNTNWGEDGYIRIPYGVSACGLDKQATYADVKKPAALKDAAAPLDKCDEVCKAGGVLVSKKCDALCDKFAGEKAKACEADLCPMLETAGEKECATICHKVFPPGSDDVHMEAVDSDEAGAQSESQDTQAMIQQKQAALAQKSQTESVENTSEQPDGADCQALCKMGGAMFTQKCDALCEQWAGDKAKDCEADLCPVMEAAGEKECVTVCGKVFPPGLQAGTDQGTSDMDVEMEFV